jgi:MerR family transcriptional regulator, thiopeptide resistance regulator
MYTVKQLSDLANVSVRTLHYYDEIGLLHPSKVGSNSYRYYDDDSLLRLQQILFYREIGLELLQIRDVLDSPDFDLLSALRSHRSMLKEKMNRLENLIETVDETMEHLTGETNMSKKRLFEAFSEEKQKEYEREARLQYGAENVNESIRRWNSYGKEKQQAVMDEGGEIYIRISDAMQSGKPAHSADVQELVSRWHQHIRNFYEPTLEVLAGLAETYKTPEFRAFFDKIHPDLAGYLSSAIVLYVDELETAELERMLAEDEARKASGARLMG